MEIELIGYCTCPNFELKKDITKYLDKQNLLWNRKDTYSINVYRVVKKKKNDRPKP